VVAAVEYRISPPPAAVIFAPSPPLAVASCASEDNAPDETVTTPSVVNPEKVIVPDDVIPVAPDTAPVPEMSRDEVSRILSQFEPMLIALSVADVAADNPSMLIP